MDSKNNVKEVKRLHRCNDLYFSICDYISKGKKPSDVCIDFKISKQRLQYYLTSLKKKNVIKKVGYGTWELTDLKNKRSKNDYIGVGVDVFTSFRGHGYVFTFNLPVITNWNNRKDYLHKKNIKYKDIPQGQSLLFSYAGYFYRIWLCNKSIVLYFPKDKMYYKKSSQDCFNEALYTAQGILRALKWKLNLSERKFNIRVSRQHHALLNNEIAKDYNNRGDHLLIKDKFGKVWLITDKSLNQDELEFIDPKQSNKDGDHINKYLNDLRDLSPPTNTELNNMIAQVVNIQQMMSNNQLLYGENIESHIGAIKTLGQQVAFFVDVISKLNDKIDKIK